MDGRVRALYKRLLHLVRSLPESTLKGGVPEARRKLRASFRESGEPLEKALDKGDFVARELEALVYLHKYRALFKRYDELSEAQKQQHLERQRMHHLQQQLQNEHDK